jgi:epoxyqueuosine reductase QueG
VKTVIIKQDLELINSETIQLSDSVDELDKMVKHIAHRLKEAMDFREKDHVARSKKEKLYQTIQNNARLGADPEIAAKYSKSPKDEQKEYLTNLSEQISMDDAVRQSTTFIEKNPSRPKNLM